ncbi:MULTISPECIES: TonB-dependent hemoglobin/transferrin/lactoferrin family receptor [unclassified Halomonas]|uniref:TonB-dependent hemoglobin/transferrin/lactoferrin family receptor n=1 Tax=unclassified Halomonas TaxID=2609666 RepID=UPI00131D80CE|nr:MULTISPECIES: TonB-dependent hemoglobin/transferrin/lactoferrin family receptor [unclassified Halomonas]
MTRPSPFRPRVLSQAVRLALCSLLISPLPALAQSNTYTREEIPFMAYDIAPGALDHALSQFATTAGITLTFPADYAANLTTPGLQGYYTEVDGLARILEGSDLNIVPIQGGYTLQQSAATATSTTVGNQTEFSTLTVEADRIDDSWVYHEPRSVSVISREQIDRRPPRHASDMLIETPGVASATNRHNPGLSVNIRGMQDFGRVNMMVDGMRQNFVQNAHQQRNGEMYVDSELLSGAVVERGPRSGVHGATAIAGSVNFQTLDYDDVILSDNDVGVRLRGITGAGGEGNGVNFIGSTAVAGRFGDNLELLAARSRRSLGDYSIGSRGGGDRNRVWSDTGYDSFYDDVKFARQTQESNLFKGRLQLTPEQSLQFTYVGTEVDYTNTTDADSSAQESGTPWRDLGTSSVESQSVAFDYNWNPSNNNWFDLNVKLYGVDTKLNNYNNPAYPPGDTGIVDLAWDFGYCDQDPIPSSWQPHCSYGIGKDQNISTRTYGIQVDNTSRFALNDTTQLSANYGIEYFRDKADSEVRVNREGRPLPDHTQYGEGEALNPYGERSIGSIFSNLTLEDNFYTLSTGLRYDHYWLTGDTQVYGTRAIYESRFDRYMRLQCNRAAAGNAGAAVFCDAGRTGGEEAILAIPLNAYNGSQYAARWEQENGFYDHHVDRSAGKLLPSLAAAIRPTDWLELYANWGKSWRPPSINESLVVGAHPGSGSSFMFPNPFADAETTTSWEVGANTVFNDLLTPGDSLFTKLGYFDTRADDYLFTAMGVALPGQGRTGSDGADPSRLAFVNNRTQTQFRGLELESRYDAGWIYGGVTYTHYLGSPNQFCPNLYFAGAGEHRFDQPNEDGSMPEQHEMAREAGYDSWEEWANNQVVCGNMAFNSVIAKPVDKGTANLGVRLFDQRLDTGLRYNYSGNGWYNQDTGGAQTWFRYTTWDWYGSYRVNDHLALLASVENLTDEMYLDGYSDALARVYSPGRTAQIGMELRF